MKKIFFLLFISLSFAQAQEMKKMQCDYYKCIKGGPPYEGVFSWDREQNIVKLGEQDLISPTLVNGDPYNFSTCQSFNQFTAKGPLSFFDTYRFGYGCGQLYHGSISIRASTPTDGAGVFETLTQKNILLKVERYCLENCHSIIQ